jgi:hypothetical protein
VPVHDRFQIDCHWKAAHMHRYELMTPKIPATGPRRLRSRADTSGYFRCRPGGN